jgi:hypothetical protein
LSRPHAVKSFKHGLGILFAHFTGEPLRYSVLDAFNLDFACGAGKSTQ